MPDPTADEPLRVLLVEDSELDAELILRELGNAGYRPLHQRVAVPGEFLDALDRHEWDVVLCDYTMPGFSGTEALAMLRERGLDVPFIFVSGTIGEETAVAAMRAGAQDYVLKDRLARLAPAIERELREVELRRVVERVETERRVAESRFREVVATAPDAMVGVDGDQRIVLFNRAAEKLFGYAAAEMVGQPLDVLLPARLAADHRLHVATFAGSAQSVRPMNERGEVLGRRRDGEEFPAEASISKLVENGHTMLVAVVRDVSGRKRDEALLRKLSRAVDHSGSLIVITDSRGVIEYANPSFLETMGYTREEVAGRTPSLWKSERGRPEDYAELWETILAGRDWHGEFENRCKDGSMRIVSATISPIKDPSGAITHFISIQEDVTRHKVLEEQLRHAQKMEAVGQLTGGLAHDFNNLLSVVIGNLELLQQDVADNPDALTMARVAVEASTRGAELTRKLLAFSRRQALETRVFDLNELVAGTTELLRRTLGERIRIRLDPAPDLWPVCADPTQLESALANLAINARDAMPEGGDLVIATHNQHLDADVAAERIDVAPGDYVVLSVSDSGEGIAPEILDRICDPFFTTKGGHGTGLGLSMVYGFVKQSGGHFECRSELGRGTTVRLLLPRGREENRPASGAAGPAASPGDASILVVEDDEGVRGVAVRLLEELGYRVAAAEDGPSALAWLRRGEPIDLLFADVVMPGGLSGVELARRARGMWPGLRVLLTSGYTDTALDPNAAVGPILNKPYRMEALARRVREVLEAEPAGP